MALAIKKCELATTSDIGNPFACMTRWLVGSNYNQVHHDAYSLPSPSPHSFTEEIGLFAEKIRMEKPYYIANDEVDNLIST